MKISLLQMDIEWASPSENIRRAEALMGKSDTSEHTDLYVLPEMWATGFATDPEGVVEEENASVALEWMKLTARQRQCALSGSLAIRTADDTCRNRHYLVTPSEVTIYDKRHLFSHGHEDRFFTPGQEAVVTEWQGWRLLLLTCYDLRFPVFSRYGRAGMYDAIVCVANWPEKRQTAWEVLTRARAIENQCYMVAVNRTGDDPVCHYAGGSVVIDPTGRSIAVASDRETKLTVDLDIEKIRQMRSHFRVLDDRDM